MSVVFRALRDVRGPGSVVTQALTCSTAVDPILVAGLTPQYAEVSAQTVGLDPGSLVVPDAARAVVTQHTFGIIEHAAAAQVAGATRAAGALLVEDSAHCVGRMARAADGTPLADVSIHSFGVEKMTATFFGGAVWVSPDLDPALRGPLVAALRGLPVIGRRLGLAARTYRTQVRALGHLPAGIAAPMRRLLTRTGVFDPPIADVENRGDLPYPAMRPSAWVTSRMADALRALRAVEEERRAAVAEYLAVLAPLAPAAVTAEMPLVRFPLFAPDAATAQRLSASLSAAGFYVGRWYRPALFPGVDDPATYGLDLARLPVTADLIGRVVNLPTIVNSVQARHIAETASAILNDTSATRGAQER
jgi:dTDP-4-amino-4,6-dideoxygalactose transaminase